MRETRVPYMAWEDPLEKGKATQSCTLAWVAKSQTRLTNFPTLAHSLFIDEEDQRHSKEVKRTQSPQSNPVINEAPLFWDHEHRSPCRLPKPFPLSSALWVWECMLVAENT